MREREEVIGEGEGKKGVIGGEGEGKRCDRR